MSVTLEEYASAVEIAWCPGCGNFPILNAVKKALVELDIPPHRLVICTGIGQAPKLPHYLKVNTFNGLHGREVASATGIKIAADDLTVLVHAGDGGAYGEGGNHLLHAIRRNIDITLVVHDNKTYALTKGQASPTSPTGRTTKVQAYGVAAAPLNPLALAVSQNCSFVAQASSAHADHLVAMLKAAIQHKGFSLLNVLQPCVVWDKVHTYKYYQDHCYTLGDDYDPSNIFEAFRLVHTAGEKIPLGLIYKADRDIFSPAAVNEIDRPLRELDVVPENVVSMFDEFS
jgi:2-oxoglutarate ferredoxin oxidoreductase subunit beta